MTYFKREKFWWCYSYVNLSWVDNKVDVSSTRARSKIPRIRNNTILRFPISREFDKLRKRVSCSRKFDSVCLLHCYGWNHWKHGFVFKIVQSNHKTIAYLRLRHSKELRRLMLYSNQHTWHSGTTQPNPTNTTNLTLPSLTLPNLLSPNLT